MRKLLISIFSIAIAGCAVQPKPTAIPMPPPPPSASKCISIPGKGCIPIAAGNVGGTTLGHENEIEDQD